jgi:regulator of sigma E protease
VFAGPFANYAFGSVLAFIALIGFGKPEPSTTIAVEANTPAFRGDMQTGDTIVRIEQERIDSFSQIQKLFMESAGRELSIGVLREGHEVDLKITPEAREGSEIGLIGVRPTDTTYVPVGFEEAGKKAIIFPAEVVKGLIVDLGRMVSRIGETPEVTGPVGIVKIGAQLAEQGPYRYFFFLATLSAYLGGFNLLPVPALDGGRLMFLAYEAVSRRKPNAKIEAHIHALGLLMFLALIAVVTVRDFQKDPGKSDSSKDDAKEKTEQATPEGAATK